MMPANVWDEIRSKIQRRVNRLSYAMWFIPTTFVADHDRTVTVRVPNALFRDWITKHNSSLIAEALEEVGRSDATISFIVTAAQRGETGEREIASPAAGCPIEERFDRVDQELAAIRRDVGQIVAKLS